VYTVFQKFGGTVSSVQIYDGTARALFLEEDEDCLHSKL
jgi:hypothetical protein